MAQRLKKDDLVQVLTGKDKGKEGKIISFHSRGYVYVSGVNIIKKHKKKTEKSEGGIIEVEGRIHESNLMLVCPEKNVKTRVGYKKIKGGIKKRIAKVSGETF